MSEIGNSQHLKEAMEGRDAAVLWFLLLRENKVSEDDFAAWRKWLAQDKVHEQEFDEVVELWQAYDQLDDLPWPTEQEMAKEEKSFQSRCQDVLNTLWTVCRPRYVLQIVSIVLLITVTVFVYQSSELKQESPMIYFGTKTAEHRRVDLIDGSVVTLGAKTKISVLYTENTRTITLHQGEAYFNVFKDKNSPFLVNAGQGTIRAIGTAFNVNMGAEKVTVTVVEGLVRIESNVTGKTKSITNHKEKEIVKIPTTTNVSGGHGIIYDSMGTLENLPDSNIETAISWQDGRLVFIDKSLDSVIADINRYSSREIVISDNELKSLRYTGTVFQNEITGWLHGLDKAFPVRIIELGERELVVIAKMDF